MEASNLVKRTLTENDMIEYELKMGLASAMALIEPGLSYGNASTIYKHFADEAFQILSDPEQKNLIPEGLRCMQDIDQAVGQAKKLEESSKGYIVKLFLACFD
jgi:hypothetical protein